MKYPNFDSDFFPSGSKYEIQDSHHSVTILVGGHLKIACGYLRMRPNCTIFFRKSQNYIRTQENVSL